jgi:hypothetical protein
MIIAVLCVKSKSYKYKRKLLFEMFSLYLKIHIVQIKILH